MDIQEFKRKWVYKTALGRDGFKIPYGKPPQGNTLVINFALFGQSFDFTKANDAEFTISVTDTYSFYPNTTYQIPEEELPLFNVDPVHDTATLLLHTYDQNEKKKFNCPALKEDSVAYDYNKPWFIYPLSVVNGEIISFYQSSFSIRIKFNKEGPLIIKGIPNGTYYFYFYAGSNEYFENLKLQASLYYNQSIPPSTDVVHVSMTEMAEKTLNWENDGQKSSFILKNNSVYPYRRWYDTGKELNHDEFQYWGYFCHFFTENKFNCLNINFEMPSNSLIFIANIIIDDLTVNEEKEWDSNKQFINFYGKNWNISYDTTTKIWKGTLTAIFSPNDEHSTEINFNTDCSLFWYLKFYSDETNPTIKFTQQEFISYLLNNKGELPYKIELHYKKPHYIYWGIHIIDMPNWLEPKDDFYNQLALRTIKFDDDKLHIQGEYSLGFYFDTTPSFKSTFFRLLPYYFLGYDENKEKWEDCWGYYSSSNSESESDSITGGTTYFKVDSNIVYGGLQTHSNIRPSDSEEPSSMGIWVGLGRDTEDSYYYGYKENDSPIYSAYGGYNQYLPSPGYQYSTSRNYLPTFYRISKDGTFTQGSREDNTPYAYYLDGNIDTDDILNVTRLANNFNGDSNSRKPKFRSFLQMFLKKI